MAGFSNEFNWGLGSTDLSGLGNLGNTNSPLTSQLGQQYLASMNQNMGLTDGAGLGLDSLGAKDWLQGGLGALNTLGSMYMGWQQNKLAKEQLQASLDMWQKNWEAQTKSYNTRLNDKYAARYAGAGDAGRANMQTPEDYASENKIS